MRVRYTVYVSLLLTSLLLVSACSRQAIGPHRFAPLTPEEAAQLRLTEEDWPSPPRTRDLPSGPRIVFQRPLVKDVADGPLIETASPTDFIIVFEAIRAPMNMDSLQIEARKWLFTNSLTNRLKPYIQGTSLQAKEVSIPAGLFSFQIEIADVAGAKTTGTYRLMARD